jgi:2',3'-cyclic-nucleotide 2'-phosphodiesterase (5'-nucleotidase family)
MLIKNSRKLKVFKFWFFIFCLGCASIVAKNEYQLYSLPNDISTKEKNPYKRVVLVATHDVNGTLNENYQILNQYFDILRKKFPKQTLFVDSGNFSGTNYNELEKAFFYYQYLGYQAITFGENEWNIKFPNQKSYESNMTALVKKHNIPLVLSNIYDLKTTSHIKWDQVEQTKLIQINGLKVGIIGLINPEISKNVDEQNTVGLFFQPMLSATIEAARSLRRRGADIVVLLMHSTLDCTTLASKAQKLNYQKVNFNPQDETVCNPLSTTYKTLHQLPPHLVDAVVGAGKWSKVTNFIAGIPMIQNFGGGKYFSFLELYYNTESKRVDQNKTVMHQPVKLCHYFLKDTEDCFSDKMPENNLDLVPAQFLGEGIHF